MMARAVMILAIASSLQLSAAFYLPGVASKTFRDGDEVNIKVQTVSLHGPSRARWMQWACSRLCSNDHLLPIPSYDC